MATSRHVVPILALLAFKRASVAADPHDALAGWVNNTTSGSPCTWPGVSCVGGRVRALDLSGMSLAGRLCLDALLDLPALQTLNLRGNSFHGNLSRHAASLRRKAPCALVKVDLSSNAFDGTLPRAFLESCGGLRFLNMSGNSLAGGGFPFPPSLRTLDMSRNQMSDAGLLNYSLAGCHGVRYLNLSANRLTGVIPELAPCSEVAVLDLSWNILSGALPARLVATTPATLTHLSIARNNISGDISAYGFGECTNLVVLDWSYNRLSGAGLPPSLAGCRRLEMLDMSGNKLLPGSMPTFLGDFPSLRWLALAGNRFTGAIPDELSRLCDTLVELDLSSNQLTGSLPASFAKCRSLQALNLGGNQLSGDFVATVIGNIPSLRCIPQTGPTKLQMNQAATSARTYPSYVSLNVRSNLNGCWLFDLVQQKSSYLIHLRPPSLCRSTSLSEEETTVDGLLQEQATVTLDQRLMLEFRISVLG